VWAPSRATFGGSPNEDSQFQQFVTADDGRKFTELYNVHHLQSAQLDRVSRVCISTIQRLYSMLRDEEIDAEIDEQSGYEVRESLSLI
jgi:type I restriction enzyme R subunit